MREKTNIRDTRVLHWHKYQTEIFTYLLIFIPLFLQIKDLAGSIPDCVTSNWHSQLHVYLCCVLHCWSHFFIACSPRNKGETYEAIDGKIIITKSSNK